MSHSNNTTKKYEGPEEETKMTIGGSSRKSIEMWCSDKLHDILGYSDSALASYLTHVASTSKSSQEVVEVLQQGGVSSVTDDSVKSFAHDLFLRAQQQQQKLKKRDTKTTAKKEQKQYSLVSLLESTNTNNVEETKNTMAANSSQKKMNEKQLKKVRHRRSYQVDDDSNSSTSTASSSPPKEQIPSSRSTMKDDDDDSFNNTIAASVEINSSSTSAFTEKELEEIRRQQDLQERDEFAKRLLHKDKEKTKQKIAQEEEHEEEQKQKENKRLSEADDADIIEKLREKSRRTYLKKREERELTLLEQSLKDEEELFASEKMTKEERKRIELQKQILQMAKKRRRSEEEGQVGEEEDDENKVYRLPDEENDRRTASKADQDSKLLMARYVEGKHEKTEQELWEESQTKKGGISSSKRKNNKNILREQQEYDYVFDEDYQIDFVMGHDGIKGYDNRRKDTKMETVSEIPTTSTIVKPMTEYQRLQESRKQLPVYAYRDEFLAALRDHQVLILVGETGSGKTTQVPQYLHEVGYSELGKIGCTQPRRVAAMSVAARVAKEMGVRLGHEVGYSIRFENCTSQKTVIQYMTDGMLLREFLAEPDLASYSCMIIDEAHERTLHTDILFGLVKDIVRFRDDLKLIISSATLDAEKFSKYFDDAGIFMIPGRMFPVDMYYTKAPEADYVDAAIVTVLQIHVTQPLDGDILVFLTGQEEIETATEILNMRAKVLGSRMKELIICPIYANLPPEQQAKIFEKTPKGARKVVLATNIAETSLTIDGIRYVIDTGFNKQKTFNPRTGMESLVVTPISQAAANQRSGRAGRTGPGKCFRLFTALSFQNELEANTVPEIMRTNMSNVVLMLKSLGIDDLLNFDFMDRPPSETLIRALEQLYALGALNDRGELTKLGRKMAEFPLDPMLSKSVIVSEKYKCVAEVLSTVSMLSLGGSVFYRPKEKAVHADTARMNFARGGGGDHIALLRCYREWADTGYNAQWCYENYVQVRSMKQARDIREQLEGLCERVEIDHTISVFADNSGSSKEDIESILKAITAGFFYNTAKLGKRGEYQTVKQHRTVYIHPSSVLAKQEEALPGWLVYYELAFTTKEFMRQVAPIQPSWLIEIAPHFYQEGDIQDSKTKKMPKQR